MTPINHPFPTEHGQHPQEAIASWSPFCFLIVFVSISEGRTPLSLGFFFCSSLRVHKASGSLGLSAGISARDNLAHGLGTYVHQNGTVYQGERLKVSR